jgi:ribosomal protein S18 acetylase RimI-like enzyme
MNSVNSSVRLIPYKDLKKLVRIHLNNLSDNVLPRLGKEFLSCFYSRMFFDDENKILVGAYIEDELVGFCALSLDPIEISKVINFQTVLKIVKMMIVSPRCFYSGLIQSFQNLNLTPEDMEISFIAVDKAHQRHGFGKIMVDNVNHICMKKSKMYVKTKTSNIYLLKFYIEEHKATIIKKFKILGTPYYIVKWEAK